MKNRCVKFLLFVVVSLFLLFLSSPDTVQQTAYEGLLFCSSVMIPALFPGFVLSDLIITLMRGKNHKKDGLFYRLFALPPACIRCFFMGFLAGFPTASDCIAQMVLSGEISKEDGERCLAFTNNPGIVFVLCAVGSGLFGSLFVGLYLWLIQGISAILVGIVTANTKREICETQSSTLATPSLRSVFPRAVVSSVRAVLNICGFIIFFRVLIAVLTASVPLTLFKTVLSGLLEITCGISNLKEFSFLTALLASLMLGWSGFSVHFQVLNAISEANLSPKHYFIGKGLQTVFSVLLTAVTYPIVFDFSLRNLVLTFGSVLVFMLIILTVRIRKEHRYGT